MDLISNLECSLEVGGVTEGMLCAHTHLTGACSGDSGGPLWLQGTGGGPPCQVGITSWGDALCEHTTPHGYARVAHYMAWIRTAAGDLLQALPPQAPAPPKVPPSPPSSPLPPSSPRLACRRNSTRRRATSSPTPKGLVR